MAIQKTLTKSIAGYAGELVAQNTIFRVAHINGTKDILMFTVEGKQENLIIYQNEFSFTPELDSSNFIAQAYEYLKTLPEFEGATDC
jgi:hypothetical protein